MKNKKRKTKKNGNSNEHGFVMLNRSETTEEVLKLRHGTFKLLAIVALRAWRGPGKSGRACSAGEAFIGDFRVYGFTEKEYRWAKVQLEKMEMVSFRAGGNGTIAKLLSPGVFDINVDRSITDEAKWGGPGADQGRGRGGRGADEGRTRGGPGATNKKERMEEEKIQEGAKRQNNTNNPRGGGGFFAPAEPAGAIAPEDGGGEAEPQGPIPVAAEPGELGVAPDGGQILTPSQKVAKMAKEIPLFLSRVRATTSMVPFTQDTFEGAKQWLELDDSDWQPFDFLALAGLAHKQVRETTAPPEGADPLFMTRRFYNRPNRWFDEDKDGVSYLYRMKTELKYEPDEAHSFEWGRALCLAEIQRASALLQPARNGQ